jgi:ribosomal-protein-alanine N-acetyltransferase
MRWRRRWPSGPANTLLVEPILTERLELVPATRQSVSAALSGNDALGVSLDALVPPTWPPEYLDPASLEFILERMPEGQAPSEWWLYFVILPHDPAGRTLIGSAGYKGPPSDDGTVEVGYGIVRDRHRQGYGSEATGGLIRRAFAAAEVTRVIAETLPELAGSIGVLRRCGFRLTDGGSEPGVIRFELTRDDYESRSLPL